MGKLLDAIRNRKKLILGVIAWGVAYAVCRLVLDMNDPEAEIAATTVAGIVVERVGPIFGVDVSTPKLDSNAPEAGDPPVVVEVDGQPRAVGTARRVRRRR